MRDDRMGRTMVRRGRGAAWAVFHYIRWRELWIGVVIGEVISLLGLYVYALLRG